MRSTSTPITTIKICMLLLLSLAVDTTDVRYCPDDYFFDVQHC